MNALHLSGMSQHLTTIHITNGIDVWNSGLKMFIDHNTCTFRVLKTSTTEMVKHARGTPHRHQHLISSDRNGISLLVRKHHPIFRDGSNTTLHVERHTLLLQCLAKAFCNIGIKHRQALFKELHHCHFRAERIEDAGEFHADNSCTNDA